MTTNLATLPTKRDRKSWYKVTLEDGKKVSNIGDIYGYYKAFEAYIDKATSDVTIKNDYDG